MIELDHAYFITVDTIGPPGQRTFYLQAAQDELVVTMVIEKEQASAMTIVIGNILQQLGWAEGEIEIGNMDLIQPVTPLFRVGQLRLGYDERRDMLLIVAEELVPPETEEGTQVHIWGTREQMAALAHKAATTVAAGRPACPLCHELFDPSEPHVCVKGNGRKRL
jgi:uncharacterized repeat protein (TIGR03847 family)